MNTIPLAQIRRSRWQPRAPIFDGEDLWGLAQSIQEIGLINPIVVFENGGGYELVAGERRSRAMTSLVLGNCIDNHTPKDYVTRLANIGLTGLNERERAALEESAATIPARIETLNNDDDRRRLHRVAVMENIERASLSPIEEARGLLSLQEEYGWSQRELARRVGKSQGYVAQRLRLLELPEVAQNAVSTRVLNTTHARALQSVPEQAADQIAEQVIKDVRKGATTREVNLFTNYVKRFLSADFYEPDSDRVYRPTTRNRMKMMQWVLETYHPDIKKLKESRVLNSTIDAVVWFRTDDTLQIFGLDLEQAWRDFAAATGRQCQNCQWKHRDRKWIGNVGSPPCRNWEVGGISTTCQRFVGESDPVIIPLHWNVIADHFKELGVEHKTEPFSHIIYENVDDFLLDYDRAVELYEQAEQEKTEEKDLGYLDDITEFQEWQEGLGSGYRFHAHTCTKCAHYRPGQSPACQYGAHPLFERNTERPRSPYFHVWVARDGTILPRCERFTYPRSEEILESVQRTRGTQIALQERECVLGWFQTIGQSRLSEGIWAPLQWIDYGRLRPSEKDKKPDHIALAEHIEAQWLMPGFHFDEIAVALIDALISEANAMIDRMHKIIEVLNPTSGEREQYVAVQWYYANGEYDWPTWIEWPENWADNPFS